MQNDFKKFRVDTEYNKKVQAGFKSACADAMIKSFMNIAGNNDKVNQQIDKHIKEMISNFIDIKGKRDERIIAECYMIGLKLFINKSDEITEYMIKYCDKCLYSFLSIKKIEENYIRTTITPIKSSIYLDDFIDEIKNKANKTAWLFNKYDNVELSNYDPINTNSDHIYSCREIVDYYHNLEKPVVTEIELNNNTFDILDKLDLDKVDKAVADIVSVQEGITSIFNDDMKFGTIKVIYSNKVTKEINILED